MTYMVGTREVDSQRLSSQSRATSQTPPPSTFPFPSGLCSARGGWSHYYMHGAAPITQYTAASTQFNPLSQQIIIYVRAIAIRIDVIRNVRSIIIQYRDQPPLVLSSPRRMETATTIQVAVVSLEHSGRRSRKIHTVIVVM